MPPPLSINQVTKVKPPLQMCHHPLLCVVHGEWWQQSTLAYLTISIVALLHAPWPLPFNTQEHWRLWFNDLTHFHQICLFSGDYHQRNCYCQISWCSLSTTKSNSSTREGSGWERQRQVVTVTMPSRGCSAQLKMRSFLSRAR